MMRVANVLKHVVDVSNIAQSQVANNNNSFTLVQGVDNPTTVNQAGIRSQSYVKHLEIMADFSFTSPPSQTTTGSRAGIQWYIIYNKQGLITGNSPLANAVGASLNRDKIIAQGMCEFPVGIAAASMVDAQSPVYNLRLSLNLPKHMQRFMSGDVLQLRYQFLYSTAGPFDANAVLKAIFKEIMV